MINLVRLAPRHLRAIMSLWIVLVTITLVHLELRGPREVTIAGTAGTLPVFTSPSQISDSIVKQTPGKIGINTTPIYPLDARGSAPNSLVGVINTDNTGTSAIDFYDSGVVYKASMGYANSAALAAPYVQNHPYVFVAGTTGSIPDLVFANGSRNNITLGMDETRAFVEIANGASAGVAPANTVRLRYNQTTNHLEASLSGAAYVVLL